jgi:PAS domain S-box-containing protein
MNRSTLRQLIDPYANGLDFEKLVRGLEVYRSDGSARPLEESPPLRALKGEVVKDQEELVRCPSTGDLRHRQVSAAPVKDAAGNIIGSVTVMRDITERKRAEAERLLLATAIEQASETIVITDREANIQYVNPAFTWTTGYARDEVYGQNPRVLKSGKQDAEFYQEMWAALNAGKLWWGEFTNRRKDGTLYQEEATIAPVRDASGKVTNYIAIKSDITERRRAEVALRESEIMLRFFVQHAPAAIAMLDRDMCYLVVSRRWMTDYHLGDRDLRGLSHYEVFPEISERWKEIHQRCLGGTVERCEEDSFTRPDGTLDWVRWEARPWRKVDDSIGGIIIFSEVVTERKRAEEALKQSEHMLRESQRVGKIGSYDLEIATGRISISPVMN